MPTIGDMGVDWDKDALRASKAPYPYTDAGFFQYFKEFIKPRFRVLEIGCQIANWYPAWKQLEPTIKYEGLDFSPVAIKIAMERYPECKFYLMNAKEMDFKEEFDVVFTHAFYQHTNLETKKAVVPRVYESLKPKGLHIIQENTSCNSPSTWLRDGWIRFFEQHNFTLLKLHDIGNGGTGFVFRKME